MGGVFFRTLTEAGEGCVKKVLKVIRLKVLADLEGKRGRE